MYQILNPIQVGKLTLKNRIAYLGMGKMIANPDHTVSDRQIAYYTNYARNNVGLMTTGACIVFPEYPSQLPCQPGLYDDRFIPGIKKLTDAVHAYGAKFFMQPWHPGVQPYGCDPSQVKSVNDWTIDEIHDMQRRFVEAAVRAKKGGCDGVEWHMAHNYLPEQFSVELFNQRTDEYGADTIENATRFSREVIEQIKEACGKDFPVSLKINGWDMGFPGGMTPERCVEICKALEEVGIDLITVSAGGSGTDITGMSGDGYREEGWKIGYAEMVKKAVHIPVMASGSIRHLDIMENALKDGKCDMIGMGRGLLAEPEFVRKIEEGRENELRYCLSCMSCFNPDLPTKQHCSMNPIATWEVDAKPLTEDGAGRKVVIIGAGPAGINAAMVLAKRGFKPVIFDKNAYIGGSIRYASAPDGKAKLKWAVNYYIEELERLQIPVYLNTEATIERIKEEKPYAVFVASGSDPIRPKSIPGIMGENVLMARDLLDHVVPSYTNEQIVVVGGGMVGMEVATTFAHKGCNATIIEMQGPDAIMAANFTNVVAFMHMQPAGVVPLFGHKVKEITDHSVIALGPDGKEVEIPATKVVIAMGFTPNTRLYEELKGEFEHVVLLGDANGVDNIAKGCREGYVAATMLQ